MTQITPARPAANAVARRASTALQAQQTAAESPQQYLTFVLGGEMFAVGILNVKEIIVLISVITLSFTGDQPSCSRISKSASVWASASALS